jgi:hypothetical protein
MRAPLITAIAAGLSAAFIMPAGSVVLTGLDRLWLSRNAAELIARHSSPAGAPLVAVGYNEPSLVFLLGGRVRSAQATDAADLLTGGGTALVSDREEPIFQQALGARGLTSHVLGDAAGFDYSNGRHLVLTLYRVEHAE